MSQEFPTNVNRVIGNFRFQRITTNEGLCKTVYIGKKMDLEEKRKLAYNIAKNLRKKGYEVDEKLYSQRMRIAESPASSPGLSVLGFVEIIKDSYYGSRITVISTTGFVKEEGPKYRTFLSEIEKALSKA